MAQITRGIRAVLSNPFVYSAFQSMMGAHKERIRIVTDYIRPFPGMKVLDVGCGPADIFSYIRDVNYWGFDINEVYVTQARNKFGDLGKFYCKHLSKEDLADLPQFDVVLALGLLHHLDDSAAEEIIEISAMALKPGGRLVTVDPVLVDAQNPLARFLVLHDRGQNVRDEVSYEALAKRVFSSLHVDIHHQTWIPYTHCIMECLK